ncbi:MAG: RHS repeat protein, partial [Chloroflexota bacterium]|nr:RHS repeat protein [Chloroflexota bacterium]
MWGEGWTFSQNIRLYGIADGGMVLRDERGSIRIYAKNAIQDGTQTYFKPPHYNYTLTKDTSTGTYTLALDGGGDTLRFDSEGKLTRRENLSGQYLTYTYDASDRLASITDVDSHSITLRYDGPGTPGRLSQITDVATGRTSTFSYTSGNLTTIRDDAGTTEQATTTLGYG